MGKVNFIYPTKGQLEEEKKCLLKCRSHKTQESLFSGIESQSLRLSELMAPQKMSWPAHMESQILGLNSSIGNFKLGELFRDKYKADFNTYFPTLLKHEGGWVDNPADRGGKTNMGITFRTFQRTAQKILGIKPTVKNLKNLTKEQAAKIYRAEYWNKIKGDDIPQQELANIMFDFAVNSGPTTAAKYLQMVLKELGANIQVDGSIGPNTLKALNETDPKEVYRLYKKRRIDFYKKIVKRDPSQKVFLKGWLKRIHSFPEM